MSASKQHQDQGERIPPLLRFLGLHLALGAAIGVALVSLIILIDLAGLRKLLMETDDLFVPLLLLYSFNIITFSSVTMGIGIMTMPAGPPPPDTGRKTPDVPLPEPVDAERQKRR